MILKVDVLTKFTRFLVIRVSPILLTVIEFYEVTWLYRKTLVIW